MKSTTIRIVRLTFPVVLFFFLSAPAAFAATPTYQYVSLTASSTNVCLSSAQGPYNLSGNVLQNIYAGALGAFGTKYWQSGGSIGGTATCENGYIYNMSASGLAGVAPAGTYTIYYYVPDTYPTSLPSDVDATYSTVYYSTFYWDGSNTPSSVNWSAIQFPTVFSSTTAAIAASSSLWQSFALASTSQQCDSGNVFADAFCIAGSYLFIPNPNILNQWATLPQTLANDWPFSWIVQVQTAFNSQSASSTSNFPAYSLGYAGVDPASTTAMGGILPTFSFFSSSTVLQYVGSSNWAILQTLIAAALWLLLATDIFFTIRNRFHRV